MTKGRAVRRGYPIHMYVGRNGSGKSLTAVYDTLPTLLMGRPVLSTVRLLDFSDPRPCEGWQSAVTDYVEGEDGIHRPVLGRVECPGTGPRLTHDHLQAHPLYVQFTSWAQFLDWCFGDVLADEITGVADSNETQSMPAAARNGLAQLRRADIAVRLTGLAWMRVAKPVRESVVAVTRCKSHLPVRKVEQPDEFTRIWRARRMTSTITYDAQSLPVDDISETGWQEGQKLNRSRLWIPTNPAIKAYDTYDSVSTVGAVTDAGRCAHCGGRRTAPECACADYVTDRAERKAASAQARPRAEQTGPGPAVRPLAVTGRHGR
jgi:hypothetical protein